MLRPVLVTPPAEMPVSLDEARAQMRVDHDDDDVRIVGLIREATALLDGYGGILGRCLVSQTWRQDYRDWGLNGLPFPDARNVVVTYRNAAGTAQTVQTGDYWVEGGVLGPEIRFVSGWATPGLLVGGAAPVSLTFTAGYGTAAEVPSHIKGAILMHVQARYDGTREEVWRPGYLMQIAPARVPLV